MLVAFALYVYARAAEVSRNVNWEEIGVIVSIAGGALAMAFRLGGVERSVKDVVARVERIERKIDQDVQPRQVRIERKIDNQDRASRRRDSH